MPSPNYYRRQWKRRRPSPSGLADYLASAAPRYREPSRAEVNEGALAILRVLSSPAYSDANPAVAAREAAREALKAARRA